MKVLDLACEHGHVFEGWFAGEDDFQHQLTSGMLICPVCGNPSIQKQLSAPRLNLGRGGRVVAEGDALSSDHAAGVDWDSSAGDSNNATSGSDRRFDGGTQSQEVMATLPQQLPQELQAKIIRAIRSMVKHSEDVGADFAETARAIHRGEEEVRPIRGTATVKETRALLEEGVDVLPLPDWAEAVSKGELQ